MTAPLLEDLEPASRHAFPEIEPVLERAGESFGTLSEHPTDEVTEPGSGGGLVPYIMPDVIGKATPLRERYRQDDDELPDYIDRDSVSAPSIAVTPRGMGRELDIEVEAREVIALDASGHAPKQQSVTPGPGRHEARDGDVARNTPASARPAPSRAAPTRSAPETPPVPDLRRRQLGIGLITAGIAVMGAFVMMLGVLTMVMAGSRLSGVRNQVNESRAAMYESLRDVPGMLSVLPHQGRQSVDAAYLRYTELRDANEPARIDAALKLISELERVAPATVSGPGAEVAAQARQLRSLRENYEYSVSEWHRHTSRFPGSTLVWVGIVTPPPEGGAWGG